MAGAILVSDSDAFSLGGLAFEYLVEKVRRILLDAGREDIVAAAYDPFDNGGLDIVVLKNLDAAQFAAFYDAVSQASQNLAGPEIDRKPIWEELLEKLRGDIRSPS